MAQNHYKTSFLEKIEKLEKKNNIFNIFKISNFFGGEVWNTAFYAIFREESEFQVKNGPKPL